MSEARALSEEELQQIEDIVTRYDEGLLKNLLYTIREREQTISGLEDSDALQGWMEECEELRQHAVIMRDALKHIANTDEFEAFGMYADTYRKCRRIARDALAKVGETT